MISRKSNKSKSAIHIKKVKLIWEIIIVNLKCELRLFFFPKVNLPCVGIYERSEVYSNATMYERLGTFDNHRYVLHSHSNVVGLKRSALRFSRLFAEEILFLWERKLRNSHFLGLTALFLISVSPILVWIALFDLLDFRLDAKSVER